MTKRYAFIEAPPKVIAQYLPGRYKVIATEDQGETIITYIGGEDFAGWTLDEYVKPRLESGLWFGLTEINEDPTEPGSIHYRHIVPWED